MNRLSQLLASAYPTMSKQEYLVDQVDYLWAHRPAQSPKSEQYYDKIGLVSSRERAHQLSRDDRDLEELLGAGVVHHLEGEPAGSLKFYMLLSRVGIREASLSEYEQLRGLISDDRLPYVEKPSIYRVNNGREYFMKFVIPQYEEIQQVISIITNSLMPFGLRPMTLLIANVAAPESDVMSSHYEDLPHTLFVLEQVLRDQDSSVASLLSSLDNQDRVDIADLYTRHASLENHSVFRPLFEGFYLRGSSETFKCTARN